jgi:SRSO17 transposase
MTIAALDSIQKQLCSFIEEFSDVLGRKERISNCGIYLSGLLLNGDRKSLQPIAEKVDGANFQSLQQFLTDSPWSASDLMRRARELITKKIIPKRASLVLDDTSFPKKGTSSVGVARQYCGALGKISNCQSLLTWQWATDKGHVPLAARLYLPEDWVSDGKRLAKAKVPQEERYFSEKWRIALNLLSEISKEVPHDLILCDAGYGASKEFLRQLDKMGERFIAQIPGTLGFWPLDTKVKQESSQIGKPGRPLKHRNPEEKSACCFMASTWGEWAEEQGEGWQTFMLPHIKKKRVKVFAMRVLTANKTGINRNQVGLPCWLLIEKHKDGKTKYYTSNLPENADVKEMVYRAHDRWMVEQSYQQLKEELGLDHYEGRSWQGFHHHVALTFLAHDFLTLLKLGKRKRRLPSFRQNLTSDSKLAKPALF